MYINSLGMGADLFQIQRNSSVSAADKNRYSYDAAMQEALEKRSAAIHSASAADGDMIITQPSYDRKSNSQKAVSEQEKQAMSMSEYRQWFRSEVNGIQAESGLSSSYLSDMLIIKEEAFEKMKGDPAWEKEVLGKIREHCNGKETAGTKAVGYQIIGAAQETCREEKIPVRTNVSEASAFYPSQYASLDYASRYYGSPYAGAPYAASPFLTQNGYWNMMFTGQSGLSNYLTQGLLGGRNNLGTLAKAAYGNGLNGGIASSLLGNFLI